MNKKPKTRMVKSLGKGPKPIKQVMGGKPIVNLDKRLALDKVMCNKPTPGPKMHSLLETLTPQQIAIRECGELASQLLTVEEIDSAVNTLKAMRQGYIIAYREFQILVSNECDKLRAKGITPPVEIEDFLVQFAMYEATKPFTEHEFMNTIINKTLPWLASVIDKHNELEEKEHIEQQQKLTEERRQSDIDIGFKYSSYQEDTCVSRTRSLVFVGWNNAVLWILDKICEHVSATNSNMIVRFTLTPPKKENKHRYQASIGGKAWANCCESDKTLATVMGTYVADQLAQRPDLLICDNLSYAYSSGFVGRPEAALAGYAHKRFRKWCNNDDVAFIGGMCLDSVPDTTEPAYQQLRTFSDLCCVSVTQDEEGLLPDHYRVVVGNYASVFDIEKKVLDTYGHGIITTPSNIIT